MRCDVEGCVFACEGSGRNEPMSMHVTCARQAGFEVRLDDKRDLYFYGMCGKIGLEILPHILTHITTFSLRSSVPTVARHKEG